MRARKRNTWHLARLHDRLTWHQSVHRFKRRQTRGADEDGRVGLNHHEPVHEAKQAAKPIRDHGIPAGVAVIAVCVWCARHLTVVWSDGDEVG